MHQATLQKEIQLEGIGLHSGALACVALRPASSGLRFVRTDNAAHFHPSPETVRHSPLCTTLVNEGGATLATVEHLMAALCALGVDNVTVEVDGPELPILDGSSLPWVELLAKAGLKKLDKEKEFLTVPQTIELEDGPRYARVEPADDFSIEIEIDYNHPQLPQQTGAFAITAENFRTQIAPARTFCLEKDVVAMREAGLIKGGSLDCAVVFGDGGIVNETALRFEDEALRHKVLDCVGDLYMSGQQPKGKFFFRQPGHTFNNQLLRKICGL